MDGLTFYKVLRIVKDRLVGATLNRVALMNEQLFFSFYTKSQIVFTFKTVPPSFEIAEQLLGDSHGALSNLSGAVLTDITSRKYDRVGFLHFSKRRPSGKLMAYTFVLEPMGNYANAFLLNEEETILFSVSYKNIDSDRDIGVGKKYIMPKMNKRYSLDNLGDTKSFIDLVGFYPLTAAIAEQYSDKAGFEQAVELIKEELEKDNNFYKTEKGAVVPFAPMDTFTTLEFDSLSFGKKSDESASDNELTEHLKRFYSKQFDHYDKLLSKLKVELQEANSWVDIQKEAEYVRNNLHLLKTKGDYKITVYGEKGTEQIDYNFSADVAANMYADKLFKKASKLKRSVHMVENRITEVEQLRDSAEEQLYFIDNSSPKELKELAELLKKKDKNIKKSVKKQEDTLSFIEYNVGDAKLYVGRNSSANHKLVFQFAIPEDLWLHAQNIPSAHGILRKEGKVSEEEILEAAQIVAGFSKNKNESKVPIDYTLRKYVKKPKNTPVGFVIYSNFKTVLVKPK